VRGSRIAKEGKGKIAAGNRWLNELQGAVRQLDREDQGTYVFDEGEQGQPAFRFRRSSAHLLVSVEESLISGGARDPYWQDVSCEYDDFRFQVFRFRGTLRDALERELGHERATRWWLDVGGA